VFEARGRHGPSGSMGMPQEALVEALPNWEEYVVSPLKRATAARTYDRASRAPDDILRRQFEENAHHGPGGV
jgi:hypothetical protein